METPGRPPSHDLGLLLGHEEEGVCQWNSPEERDDEIVADAAA